MRNRRSLGLQIAIVLAGVVGIGLGVDALLAAYPETVTFEAASREWTLQSPSMLWGLLVVPWIWLVPALGLSDLPRWQQVASAVVRSALVVILVAGLARTGTVRREERVAVVVLADVSASVPDTFLRASEEWIEQARQANPGQPLRIVAFASRPRAIVMPSTGATSYLQRLPDGGPGTDIAAALKMAYGLFPDAHDKRVVVLSDGHETDGDVLAEAPAAAEAGVGIDFVELDVDKPAEVLVQRVRVPDTVEVEAPFTLTAEVFATAPTEATATLWQDDYRQIGPTRVSLEAGLNEFELQTTVHEPGFKRFRYELKPDPGSDHNKDNNTAQATAIVSGNPRVLYVEGEPRSARYFANALRREQIDVEVRGPYGVPSTIEELDNFDLLVLSDVAATHVSRRQMELISTYVRDVGGGFLMAGGENSFGLGGYFRTTLEELLPVRFEVEKKRETPSLAIALLIDKSGSMSGQKIKLAKEAAQATVELLSRDDQVAVLAFDSSVQALVRLQSARNRVRILSQITRLSAGGGTSIQPVLAEAYRQLRPAEARLKHVILLSDGQSPPTGILELVQDMAADGITLTTVAVGNGADRNLLNTIADLGAGRAYFTNDPFNIPKIFTKETQTVARNALVEEPFRPRVVKQAQMFRGVPIKRAPYLLGYVSTRAKKGAEVLLESERGEPILARWRRGLGTAAVWTSDLKNRWAVEWVRWRSWARFTAQLVRDMMRQTDTDGLELTASITPDGRGHVVLDAVDQADRWRNGLEPTVELIDPSGRVRSFLLPQTAAGRYAADFPMPDHGSYLLKARPSVHTKTTATLKAGLAHPYPKEYLTLGTRRTLLERLAGATGGRADVSPAQLYDARGKTVRFDTELRSSLFLLVLLLFVIDVLLRRIRIGPAGDLPFV